MITNNFRYNGDVTLTIKYGDKNLKTIKHNSGTDALFKLYAMALSGADIKNMLPELIDIQEKNDDDSFRSLLTNSGVTVNKVYTLNEEKKNVCRIFATIPQNLIDKSNIVKPELVLENINNERLAVISLEANEIKGMSPGTQLLIEWDLSVSNKEGI